VVPPAVGYIGGKSQNQVFRSLSIRQLYLQKSLRTSRETYCPRGVHSAHLKKTALARGTHEKFNAHCLIVRDGFRLVKRNDPISREPSTLRKGIDWITRKRLNRVISTVGIEVVVRAYEVVIWQGTSPIISGQKKKSHVRKGTCYVGYISKKTIVSQIEVSQTSECGQSLNRRKTVVS